MDIRRKLREKPGGLFLLLLAVEVPFAAFISLQIGQSPYGFSFAAFLWTLWLMEVAFPNWHGLTQRLFSVQSTLEQFDSARRQLLGKDGAEWSIDPYDLKGLKNYEQLFANFPVREKMEFHLCTEQQIKKFLLALREYRFVAFTDVDVILEYLKSDSENTKPIEGRILWQASLGALKELQDLMITSGKWPRSKKNIRIAETFILLRDGAFEIRYDWGRKLTNSELSDENARNILEDIYKKSFETYR